MSTTIDRLRTARPDDAALRELYVDPTAARSAMLASAHRAHRAHLSHRASSRQTARQRTRRTRRLGAAAVLLAGGLGVQALATPAQADLGALAASAAQQPADVLQPGEWLRVSTTSVQRNGLLDGNRDVYAQRRTIWTSWEGRVVVREVRPGEYDTISPLPVPAEPGYATPTPAFIAALPDSPTALRDRLDRTVSGSNSHEEAVYVALTDLLRSGLLPPEMLGTVLTVLDTLPGTSAEEVAEDGRALVRLTYDHWSPVPSMWREQTLLDPDTGRIVGEHEGWPGGGSYDSRVTGESIVDELPVRVREVLAGER